MRSHIRSRILDLPPSPPPDKSVGFSTHMMVCARDAGMAVCSAKAANLAFGLALDWIFHDDGSLDDETEGLLQQQLPGCLVIRRDQADERAHGELAEYPGILQYRANQVMALKLVDVRLWSRGERTCYVDSDVLFFRRPDAMIDALIGRVGTNLFNQDLQSAYVITPDEIEAEVGIRPKERLNAGLWVMWTDDIDLGTIEGWLELDCFAQDEFAYTLDQTFISMLATSSRAGVDYLPEPYDVAFHKDVAWAVNKHYVGRIRHGFETEGLRYLLKTTDFGGRWKSFVTAAQSGRGIPARAIDTSSYSRVTPTDSPT